MGNERAVAPIVEEHYGGDLVGERDLGHAHHD